MTDQMITTLLSRNYSLPKSKPLADIVLAGATPHDGVLARSNLSQLAVTIGTEAQADIS